MSLDEITQATIAFIRAHEAWGAPIVLALAFGESLAFISLLLPATVILFGVGWLIGERHCVLAAVVRGRRRGRPGGLVVLLDRRTAEEQCRQPLAPVSPSGPDPARS